MGFSPLTHRPLLGGVVGAHMGAACLSRPSPAILRPLGHFSPSFLPQDVVCRSLPISHLRGPTFSFPAAQPRQTTGPKYPAWRSPQPGATVEGNLSASRYHPDRVGCHRNHMESEVLGMGSPGCKDDLSQARSLFYLLG